jgi:hypothetical protein
MAQTFKVRGIEFANDYSLTKDSNSGNLLLRYKDTTIATFLPNGTVTFANGITLSGAATLSGATTISGTLTISGVPTFNASPIISADRRIREVLTPTDVDAQDNTLTIAQIKGGIVVHTSVTAGGTVTTDTALNIIAADGNWPGLTANGQTVVCWYINDGTEVLTFAGGTDVTIADTGQTVAADEAVLLLFRRTSATAVTMYIVGA